MDQWYHGYQSYWDQFQGDSGDYQDPAAMNRPTRTYTQCFLPKQPPSFTDILIPRYLSKVTTNHVTRFRLGSHHLAVCTGRYRHQEYSSRICTRCHSNQVDDEHHMIFDCTALDHLRANVCFTHEATTVEGFMQRIDQQQNLMFIMQSMKFVDESFIAHQEDSQ